ncbi:DUF1641 domain-containing protein [Metallosphaera sp.]|uniref:DUF1641 domain-containing protein n=1 Tax=Metallosphaera sp. TaxID=2020860 RepID=UPI003167DA99
MESLEIQAIDKLLSPDKLMTVNKFLDLLGTLDNLGFIDLVNGALQDQELIGKVMGSIINDNTLSWVTQLNNVTPLIQILLEKETTESLNYALNFLSALKNSGILEPIIGMLNDPDALGKVMGALINDKTLQIIANWGPTLDLVNAIGNALTQENKPVKSLFDMYKMLKDPDIQKGMGVLFGIIKELGKISK